MNRMSGFERYRGRSILLGLLFMFCCSTLVRADDAPPLASAEQLEDLLGPVALYPDPLLAVILPATTEPFDIVLAARYLRNNGDTNRINDQPWDASVKALAHYPGVVEWLDSNIEWTRTVGEAFRDQQDDVMNAIQQLRSRANAAGNLSSTPQQKVITDGDDIRIVPAEPDVIYVPEYDPEIIYVARPDYYDGPMIWWGYGYPVGIWMSYDFDWRYRHIWMGDWRPGWTYRPSWGINWRMNPYHHGPRLVPHWDRPHLPHPVPMPHAPIVPNRSGGQRPGSSGRSGRTDVNGWGGAEIKNATPIRTAAPNKEPVALPTEKKPSVFGGYDRGTTTRDASDRGATSRQPAQPIPAATEQPRNIPPPPVERPREIQQAPPAATPRFVQPPPAQAPRYVPQVQQAPPPQRQAPPPPRAMPPPQPAPSVFGRSNDGGGARQNSTRGEQSRSGKRP